MERDYYAELRTLALRVEGAIAKLEENVRHRSEEIKALFAIRRDLDNRLREIESSRVTQQELEREIARLEDQAKAMSAKLDEVSKQTARTAGWVALASSILTSLGYGAVQWLANGGWKAVQP